MARSTEQEGKGAKPLVYGHFMNTPFRFVGKLSWEIACKKLNL
jgi:hypothetical protein